MISTFTREQFESALPSDKFTNRPLWSYIGVIDGEHTYKVEAVNGCSITVRSSIHEDGYSAETGEDSIRCWLVEDSTGRPMAPKVARWITRVNGWEGRLVETLRYLYRLSWELHVCLDCRMLKSAKRVSKSGPNKGRVFQSCREHGSFEWLPDYFTKKGAKQ